MQVETVQVRFKNQHNPKSEFDFLRFEDLVKRGDLSHSPFVLHLIEFYIILVITEGTGHHTIDFNNYTCKKGTIITIRKDQIHRFIESDMKGVMLLFTEDFLETYLEHQEALKTLQLFNELLGEPKIQLTDTEFDDIHPLLLDIHKEYFNINDNYALGIIRSDLHILITKLFRIKSKINSVISSKKYLTEFIDFQHSVEKNITKTAKVADYAREMGISTKTLNTITKTIINKSAKAFIDDIYIKQIKRLLINTDHPVKEIAYISGFEEIPNFYKYFKRKTQLTPEAFRSTHG